MLVLWKCHKQKKHKIKGMNIGDDGRWCEVERCIQCLSKYLTQLMNIMRWWKHVHTYFLFSLYIWLNILRYSFVHIHVATHSHLIKSSSNVINFIASHSKGGGFSSSLKEAIIINVIQMKEDVSVFHFSYDDGRVFTTIFAFSLLRQISLSGTAKSNVKLSAV